jgi:glycosidase
VSRRPSILAVLVLSACLSNPNAPRPARPTVVAAAKPGPWWQGAVFYEVFVRSFFDSNGDGVGDLPGLIAKLDYLNDGDPSTTQDLGVDALWLMPIFESPSYHGYDTTDFEHVERDYGTDADFDRLIAEAHRRGIKVVLDLMLNHTSDQHPWFQESASSPDSPKRDWYVWSHTDPHWGQPWNPNQSSWHQKGDDYYYGLFWSGMPDLNFKNPAVRAELTRIAVSWEKRGVDGFRLDAIRHLVETGPGAGQAGSEENHVFLREFRDALRAVNPQVMLVGEVWSTTEDIAPYYGRTGDDELQMLFDFPLAGALVNAAWSGDASSVKDLLRESAARYPAGAIDAPFLTNHDQSRVATALGQERGRLGMAAAMLLTLPGAPFIYYGEEIGLPNGPGNADEQKRTPMLWDDGPQHGFSTHAPWQATAPSQLVPPVSAQEKDSTSLQARYRSLIRARHASGALRQGTLTLLDPQTSHVLAFLRRDGEETVLVAHNLSAGPHQVTLPGPGEDFDPLFLDPKVEVERTSAGWAFSLPAFSSAVVRVH